MSGDDFHASLTSHGQEQATHPVEKALLFHKPTDENK
jgi:hypothetical protein